jgi:hypothetical protein
VCLLAHSPASVVYGIVCVHRRGSNHAIGAGCRMTSKRTDVDCSRASAFTMRLNHQPDVDDTTEHETNAFEHDERSSVNGR